MCLKIYSYSPDLEYKEKIGCFVKKDQEIVDLDLMTIKDREFRHRIIEDRRKFIKFVENKGTDMLPEREKQFIELWIKVCLETVNKVYFQHAMEYAEEELGRHYFGPFYSER